MMPIIWPLKDESTFSSPVGYPAAKMPTQNTPRKPDTPWTATAPTASSTRKRFSIAVPAR